MLARRRAFELCLNDLFYAVRPDFYHALIVYFTASRYAQDVLAGRNRV
jgi:hypothetical protein